MGSVRSVLVDQTDNINLQGPWLKHPGFFVSSAKATRAGQRQTDKRAESRMESRREMKKWQAGDGPAPYPSTLEISRNGSGTGRLVQCVWIWFIGRRAEQVTAPDCKSGSYRNTGFESLAAHHAPFVYRLGHRPFTPGRGVRLPYGVPDIKS